MMSLNLDALKHRIKNAREMSCCEAYVHGFRLAERWAADEATVIELAMVGSDCAGEMERFSLRECDGVEISTDYDERFAGVETLFGNLITGPIHKRHYERYKKDFTQFDLRDYIQGFIDGMTSIYEEVREDLKAKLLEYNPAGIPGLVEPKA